MKLVKTNPTATEEINSQWDSLSKSIKPREVSYYGRFINELLTTQILEHFLKRKCHECQPCGANTVDTDDDTRAHELLERIAVILRESDARANMLRQFVTSVNNANRQDVFVDFEQCLIKNRKTGVLADLGFTYAYNGLHDSTIKGRITAIRNDNLKGFGSNNTRAISKRITYDLTILYLNINLCVSVE